jgi:hypothetical protein
MNERMIIFEAEPADDGKAHPKKHWH